MSTPQQKEIWRKEKEQQLHDKQAQPREIRRRAVNLRLGNIDKQKKSAGKASTVAASSGTTDQLLRRQLGI